MDQITPMIFIPLSMVLVILCSLFLDLKLFGRLQIGGHAWIVVTGIVCIAIQFPDPFPPAPLRPVIPGYYIGRDFFSSIVPFLFLLEKKTVLHAKTNC